MKNQSITVTIFDKKGNVITKLYNRNWRVQMKEKKQYIHVFKFIYLDKQENVLDEFERPCKNKKHSLELAKEIINTSLMNDLYRIKTRKITTLK